MKDLLKKIYDAGVMHESTLNKGFEFENVYLEISKTLEKCKRIDIAFNGIFELEKLKKEFAEEGLKRASQHNFNQAEAGYNAKWFKRGALYGYQKAINKIK